MPKRVAKRKHNDSEENNMTSLEEEIETPKKSKDRQSRQESVEPNFKEDVEADARPLLEIIDAHAKQHRQLLANLTEEIAKLKEKAEAVPKKEDLKLKIENSEKKIQYLQKSKAKNIRFLNMICQDMREKVEDCVETRLKQFNEISRCERSPKFDNLFQAASEKSNQPIFFKKFPDMA